MRLKTHISGSGHIYQHEVRYIIIYYLFNKFYVINQSLQQKYSVLVLKYFLKYLYLYSSTFEKPVLVLVLVLVIFSSTCTCTRVLLSSTRPKPASNTAFCATTMNCCIACFRNLWEWCPTINVLGPSVVTRIGKFLIKMC